MFFVINILYLSYLQNIVSDLVQSWKDDTPGDKFFLRNKKEDVVEESGSKGIKMMHWHSICHSSLVSIHTVTVAMFLYILSNNIIIEYLSQTLSVNL